jgi:hypothetical protein
MPNGIAPAILAVIPGTRHERMADCLTKGICGDP